MKNLFLLSIMLVYNLLFSIVLIAQDKRETEEKLQQLKLEIEAIANEIQKMEKEGRLYAETRRLRVELEDKNKEAKSLMLMRAGLDQPIMKGKEYLEKIRESSSKESSNRRIIMDNFMKTVENRVIRLEGYLMCANSNDNLMILGSVDANKLNPFYLTQNQTQPELMIRVDINSALRAREFASAIEPNIATRAYESLPYDDFCLKVNKGLKVKIEGVLQVVNNQLVLREWVLIKEEPL